VKTQLRPGETILREEPANLQRGWETVGGQLTLTSQRLVFESHGFNVQTGATEIELSSLRSAAPCWTKLFGLVPLIPNSIALRTADNKEYRFALFDRAGWIADIARRGTRA
jgi:hypothetical protein